MSHYAQSHDIQKFKRQIGKTPLIVCDMDGNVMTGYSATGVDHPDLVLDETDIPKVQSIPSRLSQKDIAALVEAGALKTGIFADKAMDARLPQGMVDLVNTFADNGQPFRLAFLTSRGAADARTLLERSGVRNVDAVTLVADSGATLFIGGNETVVRRLSNSESCHLSAIVGIAAVAQLDVEKIVRRHVGDFKSCPELYVETKGIATNIHYREILAAFGQAEGSALDKEIGAFLKEKLEEHVAAFGMDEETGSLAFKTLDGPATVEMKIAAVNKGLGLAAIVEQALDSGVRPSAVVFTGDDVAKGNGTPGTDYYAMVEAVPFTAKYGIHFFNVHTRHPTGLDMDGTEPEPLKLPQTLSAKFPQPPIDLVVPTPAHLCNFILSVYGEKAAREKNMAPKQRDRQP